MRDNKETFLRLIAIVLAGAAVLFYGISEKKAEAAAKIARLPYIDGESASDYRERTKELAEARKYVKSTAAEAARAKKEAETAQQALETAEQALQRAEREKNATANLAGIASRYYKAMVMDSAKAWRA